MITADIGASSKKTPLQFRSAVACTSQHELAWNNSLPKFHVELKSRGLDSALADIERRMSDANIRGMTVQHC